MIFSTILDVEVYKMLTMEKKDEMIMRLVHYFVTEENYSPMVVNGVKDEIWLQNQEGPHKIIRINANYIHNEEQYRFDILKLNNVMRQVKRKTLSWSMNALNILLDVNEDVKLEENKKIESILIKNPRQITDKKLLETFPNINDKIIEATGFDLMINVANDINKKTEKENKIYESIFKPKKIVVTNVLIAINVIVFLVVFFLSGGVLSGGALLKYGALNSYLVTSGDWYRLITAAFLHGGLLHLLFNMYSLYIVGTQIENFVGKGKYLLIYFVSALSASLMSCVITPNAISVGASGAIFGLLGALVYFGTQYRIYLSSVIKNQIIPLIIINLMLGFMVSGIDNAAHIGGLIGGVLIAMALGVQKKENTKNKINGWICLIIYLAFLGYLLFFR